jgi:hypothetical protein
MMRGLGQLELGEEHFGHLVVVVLAGMNELTIDPAPGMDFSSERCGLNEFRPGADNRQGSQRHIEFGLVTSGGPLRPSNS